MSEIIPLTETLPRKYFFENKLSKKLLTSLSVRFLESAIDHLYPPPFFNFTFSVFILFFVSSGECVQLTIAVWTD